MITDYFERKVLRFPPNTNWVVQKAKIDFESEIYKKIQEQAEQKSQFTMSASQAGISRSVNKKYMSQLQGCLAEEYCSIFLTETIEEADLSTSWKVLRYDNVRTDGFRSAVDEYDIKIEHTENLCEFIVESRSSINKNRTLLKGILDFQIILRYISSAKHSEKTCDFHIRPLFQFTSKTNRSYSELKFEEHLLNGELDLFLVAGYYIENRKDKVYEKSLGQGGSVYEVIDIIDSYDMDAFQDLLINVLKSASSNVVL